MGGTDLEGLDVIAGGRLDVRCHADRPAAVKERGIWRGILAVEICDDKVVILEIIQVQRAAAVLDDRYVVARMSKNFVECLGEVVVVVNDQDASLHSLGGEPKTINESGKALVANNNANCYLFLYHVVA